MKKMFIVAGRELRAVIGTRGFWIQLLIVPLMIALFAGVTRFSAQQQATTVYAIVDQTHELGKSLADLLDRQIVAPNPIAQSTSVRVALPPEIDTSQNPSALGQAVAPYLRGDVKIASDKGPQSLSAMVLIPPGFGTTSGVAVQILATRSVQSTFTQQVRGALTQLLRTQAFIDHGVDVAIVAQVQGIVAPVVSLNPTQADQPRNNNADVVGRIAPVAFAVLMFISVFTTGVQLLNSVIEERANKLVETILSSVTAAQFMLGKLFGAGLVGLLIIAIWLGSGAVLLHESASAEVLSMVSALVDRNIIVAFVLYFLAAYVMYGAIFLGIGSTADSVQDAQSYMSPLMIVMMVPMFMASVMLLAPNGTLATVMSWIPLYTPITMMLRLPAHPPLWQIAGTSVTLLAFVALVLWLMSRVFRVSILASGGSMKPAQVWRVLTGKVS